MVITNSLIRVEQDLGQRLVSQHLLQNHSRVQRNLWFGVSALAHPNNTHPFKVSNMISGLREINSTVGSRLPTFRRNKWL